MHNKLKNTLNTIFNKTGLEKFFYGPLYPVYVALFVTLFFVTSTQLVGLLAVSLTASVIFLRFKDATPIIPLLFFVVLIFRDYGSMNNVLAYIFLAPAILSFIIKFFIYPVKNFKPGKLFVPLILVCYALFLGGITSPLNNYVDGISVMVSIGPVMLIIYVFFSAYVCPPKDFNLKKYVFYLFIILGITTCLHVLIYKFQFDVLNDGAFNKSYLGWGNINCAATLMLLTMPSCWYFITQAKKAVPFYVIIALLYFGIVLTRSAGVLGVSLAFFPVLAFFTYKNLPKFKRKTFLNVLFIATTLVLTALIVVIISNDFEALSSSLETFFSDNSRTNLYEKAFELFLKFPLFGSGLGYSESTQISSISISLHNFHSVLFHVIATMGVVGIIAYTFYYIARFKILMKNYNCFSLFATLCFIMFECYAFIDTAEFNAIPLMSTVTVLITVVELTNKKDNEQTLPLTMNYSTKTIF